MKKLLLSGLVGFAFLVFGITTSSASDFKSGMLVAKMDKCGAGKCGGEKKDCKSSKCDLKDKNKRYQECKNKCEDIKCFKKCMHKDSKGKCKDEKKGKCGGEKKSKKCGAGKCGNNS